MVSWHTTPGLSTSLTPYLQTVRRESRVTPGAPYSDKPSDTATHVARHSARKGAEGLSTNKKRGTLVCRPAAVIKKVILQKGDFFRKFIAVSRFFSKFASDNCYFIKKFNYIKNIQS